MKIIVELKGVKNQVEVTLTQEGEPSTPFEARDAYVIMEAIKCGVGVISNGEQVVDLMAVEKAQSSRTN